MSEDDKNRAVVVGHQHHHHHHDQQSPPPPPQPPSQFTPPVITMSEDDKNRAAVVGHQHHHHHPDQRSPPPPPQYGTFQGVANYPPPQPPAIGFPQPVPPPGVSGQTSSHLHHHHHSPYYPQGYQTVPGYAVAEGRPVRERRLPCCGLGVGWCLFILGFFLGAIPWYVGLFVLMCARIDIREKPGYIACTIAVSHSKHNLLLSFKNGCIFRSLLSPKSLS
ncbi:hypothetical protein KPL70_007182 [Citrus sinensis]|uniref:60S ribosomal protein L18a-like protein n=1 Tax=Citrus clementina TaxID=85681 RepID=V4TUU1_CITCL|nr:hypothetical protein CICLE_v10022163mg [Citrus x clementina]KAH9723620.1 hypothetical protein KPL70_007182 [Citrus sinensis]